MKILIAEDDSILQTMAGKFMNHWGFDFDMASNGLEATKIILRKLKYFPIMAVTGNLQAKQKYLEMGMDDFLSKPYKLDVLSEI